MGLKPVLIMKEDGDTIKIRSRLRDDYSEHEIVLYSVLNYYRKNNLDPLEKFLDLFESVIKRTVNELTVHKDLYIKYKYRINDLGKLEIELLCAVADDVGFKIEGNTLCVDGFKSEEEEPVEHTIEKHIETPEIVYKKYMERINKD